MWRATVVVGLVVVSLVGQASTADARRRTTTPAEKLGKAYTAYEAGDLAGAATHLEGVRADRLVNPDYFYWLRGQVALLEGRPREAADDFRAVAKHPGTRFAAVAAWRLADCLWDAGDRTAAAKEYKKLVAAAGAEDHGDIGTARYRIAITASGAARKSALRDFLRGYPSHPLAADVERTLVRELGSAAVAFSPDERIQRSQRLVAAHLWHESVAELMLIGDAVPEATRTRRDYWLGTTLYKMRRRYGDAGTLLLSVAPKMDSAEALFHGARAMSRADRDDDAIKWYRQVVATYPRTDWAAEAQYLTGWLEFNRGRYREAIAPLEETIRRYPKSKWMDDALWFLGMSYFLLGEDAGALPHLEKLSKRGASLEGGKGLYWWARTKQRLGATDEAVAAYKRVVARWPFAWYSLLAQARLRELGQPVGPFGETAPAPRGPEVSKTLAPRVEADVVIQRFDELESAGLDVDAGKELRRAEKALLKRHPRADVLAVLFDRYGRGSNWNRPWMLALAYDGGALDTPAEGPARFWWQHAYPEAYKTLVEKHAAIGKNPPYYLYSIMRKESGYDPHVLSYADAQGLMQMIPATTIRVARQLKLTYAPGDLYEPDLNIKTGSWYIGHLLAKFKGQIPLGAGSFNSGPRPVMKWIDQNGTRPIDELVELVSYQQTREYMKKVTENYARYVYLYTGKVYEQPLTVEPDYVKDDLTY
jgi:soluble lytic murein transglycosylase